MNILLKLSGYQDFRETNPKNNEIYKVKRNESVNYYKNVSFGEYDSCINNVHKPHAL